VYNSGKRLKEEKNKLNVNMYRPEIGAREGRLQMYGDEWLFCSVGKKASQFYDEVHKCLLRANWPHPTSDGRYQIHIYWWW